MAFSGVLDPALLNLSYPGTNNPLSYLGVAVKTEGGPKESTTHSRDANSGLDSMTTRTDSYRGEQPSRYRRDSTSRGDSPPAMSALAGAPLPRGDRQSSDMTNAASSRRSSDTHPSGNGNENTPRSPSPPRAIAPVYNRGPHPSADIARQQHYANVPPPAPPSYRTYGAPSPPPNPNEQRQYQPQYIAPVPAPYGAYPPPYKASAAYQPNSNYPPASVAGQTAPGGPSAQPQWETQQQQQQQPYTSPNPSYPANGAHPPAQYQHYPQYIPGSAPAPGPAPPSSPEAPAERSRANSNVQTARTPVHFSMDSNDIMYTDDAAVKLGDRIRRKCHNCETVDTSTWRRSNLAPGKVLCNKCGLFERTHSRARPAQFAHRRVSVNGGPAPQDVNGHFDQGPPQTTHERGITYTTVQPQAVEYQVPSQNGQPHRNSVSQSARAAAAPYSTSSPRMKKIPRPKSPAYEEPKPRASGSGSGESSPTEDAERDELEETERS